MEKNFARLRRGDGDLEGYRRALQDLSSSFPRSNTALLSETFFERFRAYHGHPSAGNAATVVA